MGRRTILPRFDVIEATSGAVPVLSTNSEVDGVDIVGYDIEVTGTLVGEIIVQYSNERDPAESDWKNLVFGEQLLVDAAVDTEYRLQIETSFKRLRLSWAYTSGAGDISAEIFGIVRGA